VKGVRIACLAYQDPNICPPEFGAFPTRPARAKRETILSDIARVRSQADLVVVSLHWGIEYQPKPNAAQKELAHAVIDAGADIVAGHHPHVQQEPEVYNGRLIIYSMGNFVFALYSEPPARKTRLYRVYANKQGIIRAEYLPLEIGDSVARPEPKSEEFVSIPAANPKAFRTASDRKTGCPLLDGLPESQGETEATAAFRSPFVPADRASLRP
jgi:poly-gamma-glutamate synthesis protein (capsule biosynthesis protein)